MCRWFRSVLQWRFSSESERLGGTSASASVASNWNEVYLSEIERIYRISKRFVYLCFLSGLGNRSRLNITNMRATDRMNRLATICTSSARPASSFYNSLVSSLLHRTNKLWVNLSNKVEFGFVTKSVSLASSRNKSNLFDWLPAINVLHLHFSQQ